MKRSKTQPEDRRAVLRAAAAIATVPLLQALPSRPVAAANLPHLSENDPTAKALKYHNDATKAPRVERSGVAPANQFCHNCALIQAQSGDWRPCQIFPGKVVNANGWCTSWTKKTG